MLALRGPGGRPGAGITGAQRSATCIRTAVLALVFAAFVTIGDAGAETLASVTRFDDTVCPQANPAGRYLNALNAGGSKDSDGIVYAAQRLIDAYHECAFGYDRAYTKIGEPNPEDRAFAHRIYARLELALAFQRVGMLAEQLQQPDAARAQYDGAKATIDDLEHVVAKCPLPSTSTTGKLVALARDLQTALVQAEAELRPATAVSPTPVAE